MSSGDVAQKIIDILLDKEIISFSFNPPYVFATTGLKSPVYIDNRLLISYPSELAYVVDEMVKLIKSKDKFKDINYVSSSLNFAAPFGILVAQALNLPLVLVREQHVAHGKKNKIEGRLPKGAKVLVVEDHVSTGAALVDNAQTIRQNGGIVNYAVAITDYEIDVAQKNLADNKVSIDVLAKGLAVVEESAKRGKLNDREKVEVLEWLKDPVKWGEVRGYYLDSPN